MTLIDAIKQGDITKVKRFIDAGANVNAMSKDGLTPLIYACIDGNEQIVDALIRGGADVNMLSALIYASMGGHARIVHRLIQDGADIQVASDIGRTPLMLAAGFGHADAVHRLITAGADINAKDRFGRTALMIAAEHGHIPVVHALIANGANINSLDKQRKTARTLARQNHHEEIVRFLQDAKKMAHIDHALTRQMKKKKTIRWRKEKPSVEQATLEHILTRMDPALVRQLTQFMTGTFIPSLLTEKQLDQYTAKK